MVFVIIYLGVWLHLFYIAKWVDFFERYEIQKLHMKLTMLLNKLDKLEEQFKADSDSESALNCSSNLEDEKWSISDPFSSLYAFVNDALDYASISLYPHLNLDVFLCDNPLSFFYFLIFVILFILVFRIINN